MIVRACLIAALGLAHAGSAAAIQAPATRIQPDLSSSAFATVDSIATSLVERGVTVGLSVSVLHEGEVVFSRGYGLADLENGVPATDSTVFRIGSLTKQMTAAIILRLIEDGRISLDDELTDFLPDFPTQGHRVTIHHLLNHTSGIRSYTSLGARWVELHPLSLSHDELVALFRDEPFDFAPGEGWLYNNSGYYLLGMIIEEVTGMDYDEALREMLFEPLGLRESRYCWDEPIIPNRARGYQPTAEGPRNAAPLGMSQPGAAGAICGSTRDLVRWDAALRSGAVIPEEAYLQMSTPSGIPEGGPPYAYGLLRDEFEGVERVHHTGGINGFNAAMAHFPEADLTIAALVNLNGSGAGQMVAGAARALLGTSP